MNDSKESRDLILERLDSLPFKLKESILSNFMVDGVDPVNMNDIRTLMEHNNNEIMEELKKLLPSAIAVNNGNVIVNHNSKSNNNSDDNLNNNRVIYKHFTWGGKFRRMVPHDFVFPTCDFKTAFD